MLADAPAVLADALRLVPARLDFAPATWCAAGNGGQSELSLLILDPSCSEAKLAGELRRNAGWQALLRCGRRALRCPKYQLLFLDPGLADCAERQALRQVITHELYIC